MTEKKPTVVVAMSGGVDSSVAAALLVEQGYTVIGMMLRLWNEPGMDGYNRCCTPDDMAVARRIANHLEIPFYAVDVRERFKQEVVDAFIEGYRAGDTPNPCMRCNRHIRWGFLLQQAQAVGADYMATGHYARVQRAENGRTVLLKGVDASKDQSYILSVLNQDQLSHSLFPLGQLLKSEVRELARRFDLPVAEKSDSQDLCFLGKQDYRQFLARNAPETIHPGLILNGQGETIGTHQGLAGYTIGQRKGLGIASARPLYVIHKDIGANTLIVGEEDELGQTTLTTGAFNWGRGGEPSLGGKPTSEIAAEVKIRYKSALIEAVVKPLENGGVQMNFTRPVRDITPGQLAVAYNGDCVLGSGVILRAGRE